MRYSTKTSGDGWSPRHSFLAKTETRDVTCGLLGTSAEYVLLCSVADAELGLSEWQLPSSW